MLSATKHLKRFFSRKNVFRMTPVILILLISIFFRTYKVIEHFEFAHDGDLFSWIVKDIVVDRHPRLIGQLTSAPGIFIGPLFYYLLIPFFLLFKMDPIGAIIPITIIGILTTFSYWYVFKKLWSNTAGLIASFLQAVLYSSVYFDRRVVPSTPSNIWTIWYFYCVVQITRGNLNVLMLLGFLVGLIWHVHIALLPALAAIPIALLVAKKLPSKKQFTQFLIGLGIPSAPLFLFEVRHNFSQSKSFIENFFTNHGSGTGGGEKLMLVLQKLSGNIDRLFFYPTSAPVSRLFLLLLILALGILLVRFKTLRAKELLVFYLWILFVIVFFSFSSSILSEYYFYNLEVIFICLVALFQAFLFNRSKYLSFVVIALLGFVLFKNVNFITRVQIYKKGYNERKNAAAFIAEDSRRLGFPCISVSYITSIGEDVGFRYFFYLLDLHVNLPISGSPVYSIVNPPEYAQGKNERHFGQIKVIPPPPNEIKSKEEIEKICMGENSNLVYPMFGFTK